MIKKLVIDGNEWLRGSIGHLNQGGQMCCLGILGRALGVPLQALANAPNVCSLPNDEQRKYPIEFISGYLMAAAVRINDSFTTDANRAEQLRPVFAEVGIELEFVNVPGVDGCPLEVTQ